MNSCEYSNFCCVVTMWAAERARVPDVQVTSQFFSRRKTIIVMMTAWDGAPVRARAKALVGGTEDLKLV
jgi:hypothetical protein